MATVLTSYGGSTTAPTANTGAYVQGAGVLFQAIGSVVSAINARNNANFQSGIAALNARSTSFSAELNRQTAENAAQSVLAQGQAQIAQLTKRVGKIKGQQQAAMAAQGVDLGVGNAAEITASTDLEKENDVHTLEANALRAAWGYRLQSDADYGRAQTQAQNYRTQSALYGTAAEQSNPVMAGATSLIGGAGTVASRWYSNNRGFD